MQKLVHKRSLLYIGLKLSRTKDYLSELVEEGNTIANGANKNRTYSLKKQEKKEFNSIEETIIKKARDHF